MKMTHLKISGGQNDIVIVHGRTTVTEDSSAAVAFPATLPHLPHIAVTPISNDSGHTATVDNITVGGFTIYLNKQGGGAAGELLVNWVAVS